MSLSRPVIVDSGFWIALYDPRDQYHQDAKEFDIDFDALTLIVPWPSLYETFSTRFVKDQNRVVMFMTVLRRRNVILLDDRQYRDSALELDVASPRAKHRPLSLVDRVIRIALEDASIAVQCLVTFNPGDFHDVCRRQRIELLPH